MDLEIKSTFWFHARANCLNPYRLLLKRYTVRSSPVVYPSGLTHKNNFFQLIIQICRFVVEVLDYNFPLAGDGQQSPERHLLCHRCEHFIVVSTILLGEALCYDSRFVPHDSTLLVDLRFEHSYSMVFLIGASSSVLRSAKVVSSAVASTS